MDLSKQTFDYNGLPVACYSIGDGRPLLLLHGWASESRVMFPLAHSLSTIRCCHLIDLPGFGQTPSPPSAWSVDDYADLVESRIEKFADERIDLLAHSYGGRITLKLLARPGIREKIDKVIITGGAGLKPKRKPSYFARVALARMLKAPLQLLPQKLRQPAFERLRGSAIWKRLGSSDYRNLSGVMRETFVKSVRDHLDHLLPGIERDLLLIWGSEDEATPPDQAKRMERGIRGSALVMIEGAGHFAFLDRPGHFSSIARAYLKE